MARKYILGLRGSKLRAAQIWAVILPAYILFGYNQSVAGSLLDLSSWVKTFPQIDTANTKGAQQKQNALIQGTTVAMYTLGCFFGALSCIPLGDRLGRIKMIQLGSAVHIVGAILESSSYSLGQLIAGRLVCSLVSLLLVILMETDIRSRFWCPYGYSAKLAKRVLYSRPPWCGCYHGEPFHQHGTCYSCLDRLRFQFRRRLSFVEISSGV